MRSRLALVKWTSPQFRWTRSLSWTQFGPKANEEAESDDVQLYSERRLLGYSKEQVNVCPMTFMQGSWFAPFSLAEARAAIGREIRSPIACFKARLSLSAVI